MIEPLYCFYAMEKAKCRRLCRVSKDYAVGLAFNYNDSGSLCLLQALDFYRRSDITSRICFGKYPLNVKH